MARGGKRRPADPAPVSGPGALSERTDGGPSQPIRVPTGGPYGSAQASEQAQQAAPLPATPALSASTGAADGGPPPIPLVDAFGPTRRPGEDPRSGLVPPGIVADDPDVLLRALRSIYPHPDIDRLIG